MSLVTAVLWPMLVSALVSYLAGRLLIVVATPLRLIDRPSGRGMHTGAVARAGGLAVGIALAAGLASSTSASGWPAVAWAGAAAIWVLGLADDRWRVPALWRFIAQFAIVGATLAVLPITLPGGLWLWCLPAAVGWIWCVNLHNFMDGIDGIAAVQAVTVFVGMGMLTAITGEPALAGVLGVVAAAYAGFGLLNWTPAQLFLGDSGSTLLGYLIGLGTSASVLAESTLAYGWLILSAVFFVDATWTLLVRLLTGQRWYQPHRLHAYQRIALRWGSHTRVSTAVAAINVFWLLPLALVSVSWPKAGPALMVLAYAPLVGVAWSCHAGRPAAEF